MGGKSSFCWFAISAGTYTGSEMRKFWVKIETAVRRIGFSRGTINRRCTPWQDAFDPFKIRIKSLQLRAGGQIRKRCYLPDVDALGMTHLPNAATVYVPIFHDSSHLEVPPENATTEQLDERLWVSSAVAGAYLDVSPDTIERLAVPLADERVPFGIRRWDVPLREGGRQHGRYFLADVDAMLTVPTSVPEVEPPSQFHR